MAVSFDNYLKVSMDDVTPTRALPLGHYFAKVVKWELKERDYKNNEPKVVVVEMSFRTTRTRMWRRPISAKTEVLAFFAPTIFASTCQPMARWKAAAIPKSGVSLA